MEKITLQDIINKKLNTCTVSPDELITDAYLATTTAEKNQSTTDYVLAYIYGQVAVQANEKCGIRVPNVELDVLRLKKECGMTTDQEIADYYMEHLDK